MMHTPLKTFKVISDVYIVLLYIFYESTVIKCFYVRHVGRCHSNRLSPCHASCW